MDLVIDTNVFIDAENSRLDLSRIDTLPSDNCNAYIAAITVSELLSGVHLAKTADVRIKRSAFVEGIIANVPVLEFNEKVARCYGELYAHFLKSRTKANNNVHDLQIAATCIAHGCAILTNNIADFKRIPGLKVVRPTAK